MRHFVAPFCSRGADGKSQHNWLPLKPVAIGKHTSAASVKSGSLKRFSSTNISQRHVHPPQVSTSSNSIFFHKKNTLVKGYCRHCTLSSGLLGTLDDFTGPEVPPDSTNGDKLCLHTLTLFGCIIFPGMQIVSPTSSWSQGLPRQIENLN